MALFRPFTLLKRSFTRSLSSKGSLVNLSVDQEGIALLTMNRLPVNSLNLELLQGLSSAIGEAQKNQCKGLVLTSAARVFSAGVDLNDFYKPNLPRLRAFWTTLQDIFLQLYGSGDTISTAAINGYTAAGGCVVTLFCDYRVMVAASEARIGLNETAVGVVPRPWVCELAAQLMGRRHAEIATTASTMYNVEEALKVNLIDEVASDKDDAIERCKQFIRRYDNIPIHIRAQTKSNIRENTIKLVKMHREEDLKQFTDGITSPYAQSQIKAFADRLRANKQAKLHKAIADYSAQLCART